MKPLWHTPTFPSPRHERVYNLLRRLVSEGAAAFFADACDIVQRRPPYRTATHIVSHLLRDVESATRQVLITLPKAAQHFMQNQPGGPSTKKKLKKGKKDDDGATHLAKVETTLDALGLSENETARAWCSFVGDGSWSTTTHRNDLRSPLVPDDAFLARFDQFVNVLAVVLDAAERNYATVLTTLDDLIGKGAPTAADLNLIAPHLATGVTALGHIFERVPAGWLVALRDRKVFQDPPETQAHEGGSFTFPLWPQAWYLVRIAAEMPEEVASTIENVPVTDNQSVHVAFLDAALRMPPKIAARVAAHEAPWLNAHPWFLALLSDSVEKLVLHLIDGDELDAAVTLLKAALSFLPQERPSSLRPRPNPRMPGWEYEKLVENVIPRLAAKSLEVARDLLVELIEVGQANCPPNWRAAIEDSGQNGSIEAMDTLLVELRDLYEAALRAKRFDLRDAVHDLEARGSPIFARLALYLLRLFGSATPDLVVERATDQRRLDATGEFHELAEMIGAQFPNLNEDDKTNIVETMRENASPERLRRQFAKLPEKEIDQLGRLYLRRLFAVLGAARPRDIQDEYALLCEGIGEPKYPTYLSWFEIRSGPSSPKTAAALLAMSDTEMLEYLREWIPDAADRFGEARTMLGQELKKCAATSPERFSKIARSFRDTHQEYVSGVLWGLYETANLASQRREEKQELPPIDWESVLDLADWAVSQFSAENGSWTRRICADVAEHAALDGIERGERALVVRGWNVARALLADTDPSPEKVRTNKMDDETFALNTVRGQALLAAIEIARAVATSEVRDLLEEILTEVERRADAEIEPSGAIRAVLAQRMSALLRLDEERAQRVAGRLFPPPDPTEVTDEQRRAWHLFLSSNDPGAAVLTLLREHFDRAVERVDTDDSETVAELGKHLGLLAAWGVISPDSPRGELKSFIEHAPIEARRHALNTIGRALHHTKENLPPDTVARLQRLWEWWSSLARVGAKTGDLTTFGWWFTSSVFEPGWALRMLDQVLSATSGAIEWEHEVALKLVELAPEHPERVAVCLQQFVDGGSSGRVPRCKAAIRLTLQALAKTAANETAKEIAGRLTARGWRDFLDLA